MRAVSTPDEEPGSFEYGNTQGETNDTPLDFSAAAGLHGGAHEGARMTYLPHGRSFGRRYHIQIVNAPGNLLALDAPQCSRLQGTASLPGTLRLYSMDGKKCCVFAPCIAESGQLGARLTSGMLEWLGPKVITPEVIQGAFR